MTTNRARARRILESMTNRWGKPATARDAAQALADAGLLAPDGMAYEYGDNGWDEEAQCPVHYPVEQSCRDDDHVCPEPAPPRYRRPVGPWEEA